MHFIDLSFDKPESNIAFDEALLENAEKGLIGESLRVWESPTYFAVLGYSSHWKSELREPKKVPFIRRKSGGQTVLQGPGCLNFSLVIKNNPATGIRTDTQSAMQKNQSMIQDFFPEEKIELQGVSDLVWNKRKFSGNAMRRIKDHHLFHGTFLYAFDLNKIEELLGKPDREPEYRKQRSHSEFLTNIPLPKPTLIQALQKFWNATNPMVDPPLSDIPILEEKFYTNTEWNQKF